MDLFSLVDFRSDRIGDTRNVVLVKARDVHLTLNINKVLRKEGFSDFHAKYIGGMWLWLEFDSVESCTKLQSNKEMAWYFTQIKHIAAPGVNLFLLMTIQCGKPLASGRVCIRSKIHGHIKETCKVMIKGKVHYVRVKEFAGWVPDMEAGDGVQDALDVEEGEIPAKDVAKTEEVKNSQSFFWEKDNGKEDHNTSPSSTEYNYTTNLNSKSPNIPCEESDSLSKPPGFEKPKYHTKHNTHHSSSSCPGVKSSRISKPVSKAFSNHGSMIEALVTQIEMGKVLGYDMQAGKCKAISKLCNKHNINFLGIQETHSSSIDSFKVKSMWGNFRFDFAFCPSVGRSGGILSIWDTNVFSKINVHPFDHFLIVEGKWVNENFQCFMVNVYAPQEDRNKVALWNSILEFKENHPGHYVVFGDFNAVRYASERIGTLFKPYSCLCLNQFIGNGTLWELTNG
ncbi:RNA-directed DNA polymerase, eukaryota [Tanacetum coccineum]